MRINKALQKVTDKRTFLRLKAVLLFAQGMHINDVVRLIDKSRQIIYYWVRCYLKDHQPFSLYEAQREGRPPAAPDITDERIIAELRCNPLHLGYNTTGWTVALLARHLSTCYGCDIRPRTLRRRMKQAGLRFKRPRYVYSEKDPHRAQKKGGYRAKAKWDAAGGSFTL